LSTIVSQEKIMSETFSGKVEVQNTATTKTTITLDSSVGDGYLGGNGTNGTLILSRSNQAHPLSQLSSGAVRLEAAGGAAVLGGSTTNGKVTLIDSKERTTVRLESEYSALWLGGNGQDGDILIFDSAGDNISTGKASIQMDGTVPQIILRKEGKNVARLEAGHAALWLGGNGDDGDVVLFAASGDNASTDKATIHLNGSAGDIILRNGDLAEDFDVVEGTSAEAGTVMVFGTRGCVEACASALDRRVAGIVAGAGSYRPGIILDRQDSSGNRRPLALMGKVYCKVDALYGAIRCGDLLTTSPTSGHAMRVPDDAIPIGAVIGKAMDELENGRGLIPMLVTLM
jgi:hypothetical protein